jgi:hypothetical protein
LDLDPDAFKLKKKIGIKKTTVNGQEQLTYEEFSLD